MEEPQETQQYAGERDRRRNQKPYEGDERRKAPGEEQPIGDPDETQPPVSDEDGTGRR